MASTMCPQCGALAPGGARFCPNCAAPLGAIAPPAPPAATALPPSAPEPQPQVRGGSEASRWVKVLIVTLVVAVVAAVAVVVILARGVGQASRTINDALIPKAGRPAGYHGPAYPGMLTQDHVAAAPSAPIDVGGEILTAGDLKRTLSFLGPTLCSAVTIVNQTPTTKDVGPAEWKLQQPNGIVETFAITGTLLGGQIAPGGTASGTACFADPGQSGNFVLLWQPLLRTGRGVWLLHL